MSRAAVPCTITRSTLHGGRRDGLELLEIANGTVRVALLPQRGMGIWKAWAGDRAFGWDSPLPGPVHPWLVPLHDPDGKGWLEGFDELLCRCGLRSNGAPDFGPRGELRHPLHGRIANLPADDLDIHHDATSGAVTVSGVVHEVRFLHHHLALRSSLHLRPGESGFTIHDEVINLGATPCSAQLLYHYNLGAPLLGADARLYAPVAELAPRDAVAEGATAGWDRFAAPLAGFAEQVYYTRLRARADGSTAVLLCSADDELGASLHFNVAQLPCFSIWKNTADARDGYVMGMEPGTNFPNARGFEEAQGRVLQLAPGDSRRFELRFGFHLGAAAVRAGQQAIAAIAGGTTPLIHPRPRPGWSPQA